MPGKVEDIVLSVGLDVNDATNSAKQLSGTIEKTMSTAAKKTRDALADYGKITDRIKSMQQAMADVQKYSDWSKMSISNIQEQSNAIRKRIQELQEYENYQIRINKAGKEFAMNDKGQFVSVAKVKEAQTELKSLEKEYERLIDLRKKVDAATRTDNLTFNLKQAFPEARTIKDLEDTVASLSGRTKKIYENMLEDLREYSKTMGVSPDVYFVDKDKVNDEVETLKNSTKQAADILAYFVNQLKPEEARRLGFDNIITQLEAMGYQFTETGDKASKMGTELSKASGNKGKDFETGAKRAQSFTRTLNQMYSSLQRLSRSMNRFLKSMYQIAKGVVVKGIKTLNKHFGETHKHINNSKSAMDRLTFAVKKFIMAGIGVRSVYFLFRKFWSMVREGVKVMAQLDDETNHSLSAIKTATNQLQNQLGSAMSELINAVYPILVKIINLITMAIDKVTQLFAALRGQTTYKKAVAVWKDYRKEIDKSSKSAKKLVDNLSGLDEIHKWQEDTKDDDNGLTGGEFVTAPIDKNISDLAKKIKDLIKKLLYPIKKAWADIGPYVIKSWKRAFESLKKLLLDIGRDFLIMWQQEKTVEIFRELFRIIGHIGQTVANLADNLDAAWNEGRKGLHIFEAIRDIILIVIDHIEDMFRMLRDWSATLDFNPLLQSILDLLESIKPVADAVWGTIKDFFGTVILPFAKWLIEVGGPKLIDVFTKFNESVPWTKIRVNLEKIWESLEPFMERVGEGLIYFIDTITTKLAGFLGSDEFAGFLQSIADFFDGISQEDINEFADVVVGALKLIVGVLGRLIKDLKEFIQSKTGQKIINKIKDFFLNMDEKKIDRVANAIETFVKAALLLKGLTFIGGIIKNLMWIGPLFKTLVGLVGKIPAVATGIAGFVKSMKMFGFLPTIANMFPKLAPMLTQLSSTIFPAISTFFTTTLPKFFSTAIGPAFAKIGSIVVGALPIIGSIIVGAITGGVTGKIADNYLIPAIMDIFNIDDEDLKERFKNFKWFGEGGFFDFDNFLGMGEISFDDVKGAFDLMWEDFKGFIDNLNPIDIGIALWEKILGIFDIFTVEIDGVAVPLGQHIIDSIEQGFTEKVALLKIAFEELKQSVVTKFNEMKDNLLLTLIGIKVKFDEFVQNVIAFKDNVVAKIIEIKTNIVTHITEIKNSIVSVFENIKTKIKSVINNIITFINRMISGIAYGINAIIGMLNRLKIDVPDWVTETTGISSFGFNLPKVSAPQIPLLAQGAVIPANQPFLAMLGDQSNGRNLEAPEGLIRQIIREEMGGMSGGNSNYQFTAQLNRKTLFDEMISEAQLRQSANGNNPFTALA